jgi:hypothetical protein
LRPDGRWRESYQPWVVSFSGWLLGVEDDGG